MNFEVALLANVASLILAKPGELNYVRMERECYCQLYLGYILVHCENTTMILETNLFAMTSLNLIADNLRAISSERSLCTEIYISKNLLHCFVVLSFLQAIN